MPSGSSRTSTAERRTPARPAGPPRGNAIIGQSGGPTVVINQSLVGLIEACMKAPFIDEILGARHGVAGILKDDFVRLTNQPDSVLRAVADTPAAALGSVRKKPSREDCLKMFDTFRKRDVRYLFYVGGNDTAETANILLECAKAEKYPIRVFHVPKTIDNDLMVTDHCPGYGSAAKFVAQAFMGDDLDNRSLRGVKINIVMGRLAGFLTAASTLGRSASDAGPHLVYVPEVPFNTRRFVADVKHVHKRYGRCVVAVSEGIRDARGKTWAEKVAQDVERDAHGNVQLSGTGSVGDYLIHLVKEAIPGIRARVDTLGYLQRSFVGCVSDVDAREAYRVGRDAVAFAARHRSGTVVLKREKGARYKCTTALAPLKKVAKVTKPMDRRFINKEGNDVTQAFLDYARPLVGPLPRIGRLRGI